MKSIIAILSILSLSIPLFSQNSNKIFFCKQDSTLQISIIPEDILTSDYDMIVLTIKNDSSGWPIMNEGYEIEWPTVSIDGSFTIVINPRQIYLRTSHDNPNPNYLYWIKNINTDIFNKIATTFNDTLIFQKTGAFCGNNCISLFYRQFLPEIYIPGELSDSIMAVIEKDHHFKTYENFKTIIELLNRKLLDSESLIIPDFDSFKEQKIKRILYGLYELEDQIRFDKLK